MPKMKTRKSVAKRFELSGSGKVMRRHAFKGHLMINKSPARSRRLRADGEITGALAATIRQSLPYA